MKTIIFLFLSIFLFTSCAKFRYMAEQSWGQVKLETSGRSNQEVLKDKKVSDKHKKKIKLIIKAKKFFYDYFDMNDTNIYEQTTLLDSEAVTYLVIHSKKSYIKAQKTSIPFLGEFPYLGFFKKKSAFSYKKELERRNFHTYMRPVYAYSTLNHPWLPFDDNILSSFFFYSDQELVHLIFHELVHTVIFVKNNVRFNENFAEFIATKLMNEFSSEYSSYQQENNAKRLKGRALSDYIVAGAKRLNLRYKKTNDYAFELKSFLADDFLPGVKTKCLELKIKRCWPLKTQWNNARFAAFNTYAAKSSDIEAIFQMKKLSLRKFLLFVKKREESYNSKDKFIDWLKQGS